MLNIEGRLFNYKIVTLFMYKVRIRRDMKKTTRISTFVYKLFTLPHCGTIIPLHSAKSVTPSVIESADACLVSIKVEIKVNRLIKCDD